MKFKKKFRENTIIVFFYAKKHSFFWNIFFAVTFLSCFSFNFWFFFLSVVITSMECRKVQLSNYFFYRKVPPRTKSTLSGLNLNLMLWKKKKGSCTLLQYKTFYVFVFFHIEPLSKHKLKSKQTKTKWNSLKSPTSTTKKKVFWLFSILLLPEHSINSLGE